VVISLGRDADLLMAQLMRNGVLTSEKKQQRNTETTLKVVSGSFVHFMCKNMQMQDT